MDTFDETGTRMNASIKGQCFCLAKYFQIEDLALSAFFEEDRAMVACEGEATLTLRRESK